MSEQKSFTSSPTAKKLAKAFGANKKTITIPSRKNLDAIKFIDGLKSAYEASQESKLQFG